MADDSGPVAGHRMQVMLMLRSVRSGLYHSSQEWIQGDIEGSIRGTRMNKLEINREVNECVDKN